MSVLDTGAAPDGPSSVQDNHRNNTDHYDAYYEYYQDCGLQTIPSFNEYKAAEVVVVVLYPLLLVLGTLGNGVSVVVLSHLSEHAWSSCLYLAVLSVVELVVLYIRCGNTWLLKVAELNPSMEIMNSSDAMCKTYLFVLNVLLQMWPWLMVALSVELVISTKYPLKTYRLCTTERARATVLLITILLICLNLNYFWTWGLYVSKGCIAVEEFSLEFLNIIWPSIETSVKHILPLTVVTVAFFLSVISLLRSGRHGAPSYEPILKKYFLDLQALQQLKHAALITVLLFIIIKTFTFAVELLNALELRSVIVVPCEQYAQFKARLGLVRTLMDSLVYSFHSLKFFVYFAVCASFRRKVFSIVRKVFFCIKTERNGQSMKNSLENRRLEQIEDVSGPDDNSHRNFTGLRDINGHHPTTVLSKTTHV